MGKRFLVFLSAAALVSSVFGCTRVRTYSVEKERVDQNLAAGNMGYLSGTPSESEVNQPRKMTRKTYVAEVEIGRYKTAKKKTAKPVVSEMAVETVQEPASEPIAEPTAAELAASTDAASVTMYTVEPNDTLGKISQKVYGSAKKWKKIFEANSDHLKSPDKIYAGQVLKIPQE